MKSKRCLKLMLLVLLSMVVPFSSWASQTELRIVFSDLERTPAHQKKLPVYAEFPAPSDAMGTFGYDITAILPPAEAERSSAHGINSLGEVVGRFYNFDEVADQRVDQQAFKWSLSHGPEVLTPLAGEAWAWEINDDGMIAGICINEAGHKRAVRWNTSAASPVEMGTLTNTNTGVVGDASRTHGINNLGSVVGNSDIPNDAGDFVPFHGFVFREAAGLVDIGTFTTSWPQYQNGYSHAYDINDHDVVVGLAGDSSFAFKPLVWDPDSGTVQLPVNPDYSTGEWQAVALNDSDLIAGHVIVATKQHLPHYWADRNTVPVRITMPAEFPYGEIYGVNASGTMVGIMWSDDTEEAVEHAFIYDHINGVRDLNDLIDSADDWVLTFAQGINDAGQIAGTGDLDGVKRGYILTPHNGLTIDITGQGSVSKTPDAMGYAAGTTVQLIASPDQGWTFSHWTGPVADTASSRTTVTINSDTTVAAVFVASAANHTLTIQTSGQGSVTQTPEGTDFPFGTVVQLTALPDAGWQFSHWTGPVADPNDAQTIVTMDSDVSVAAVFTAVPIDYVLTTAIEGQGSVTRTPDAAAYAAGTVVQLDATAETGWQFSHWTGPVADADSARTSVTLNADTTVTCVFSAAGEVDRDQDGVSDQEEQGPDGTDSNYDGNADGTPDAAQGHVTSTYCGDGIQYVTLAVEPGLNLIDVSAIDIAGMTDIPSDASFEWGLFRFTVTGIPVGGNIAVRLYLPADARPDTFYKFGPTSDDTTNHWYEFSYDPATGIGVETDLNVVTLHLQDGGLGDDDMTANGEITDDGGPVTATVNTSSDPGTSGSSSGDGGSSGCFIQSMRP